MRRVEMEKEESEGLRSTGRIQEEGETRSRWKEILSFFFFFFFNVESCVCVCVRACDISKKNILSIMLLEAANENESL